MKSIACLGLQMRFACLFLGIAVAAHIQSIIASPNYLLSISKNRLYFEGNEKVALISDRGLSWSPQQSVKQLVFMISRDQSMLLVECADQHRLKTFKLLQDLEMADWTMEDLKLARSRWKDCEIHILHFRQADDFVQVQVDFEFNPTWYAAPSPRPMAPRIVPLPCKLAIFSLPIIALVVAVVWQNML